MPRPVSFLQRVQRFARTRGGVILIALSVASLVGWWAYDKHDAVPTKNVPDVAGSQPLALADTPVNATPADPTPTIHWQTITLKRGDSLSKVFHRLGIPQKTLLRLTQDPQFKQVSRRLRATQRIHLAWHPQHALHAVRMPVRLAEDLLATRHDDGTWVVALEQKPLVEQWHHASFTVHGALSTSAASQQVPSQAAHQLAAIFGGRFNMRRDLRAGDQFVLLYPTYTLQGRVVKVGDIQMATLMHRGDAYEAIRYTPPGADPGYYTLSGQNLQSAFMRYPCRFKRVSSPFNLHRLHPIMGVKRPHHGVDLAAPRGTPVHVTANGTVIVARYQGGYGRVIKVQHGTTRTTVYAHLSRYAKGIKRGRHVRRGEVIGYVGSTGFATGPHLHYEMRVHGQPQNPLTVALPKGRALTTDEMPAFRQVVGGLQQQIHSLRMAAAQPSSVQTPPAHSEGNQVQRA